MFSGARSMIILDSRIEGFRAVADIGVVVGESHCACLGDRLGDLGAAVADIHAIETGKGVEAPLAPSRR